MNFFKSIENDLFEKEEIIFNEKKIQEIILQKISEEIDKNPKKEGFCFEKIIYDFFDYLNFDLIKTKKTRDAGIDGIISLKIEPFGNLKLGLQIKYKIIDSTDIDKFIQALNYAELKLGVITCKESRRLIKYELNSKLKALFLTQNLKNTNFKFEKVDLNPVFILKLKDVVTLGASKMRAIASTIYKK